MAKATASKTTAGRDGAGTAEIPGFCTLCRSRCGTVNTVANGSFIAVRPDEAHPTGKAICAKGRAAPEIVHSPRRLTQPLRRTNPKTAADPGWVEITWAEAMDILAGKLDQMRRESGSESVAFAVTSPSGTALSDSIDWVERLVWSFGSPNICYATEICNWHKDHAHAFTFGTGIPTPDYAGADLIILWGHNPANVWLAQATTIGAALQRGTKLMVIDPRKAGLGTRAEHWLRVRPGTDGALALGLAHLLIAEGTYNTDFVRNWTNAPLLVRADTGRFLRPADLGAPGTATDFYAWRGPDAQLVTYDTTRQLPEDMRAGLALEGDFEVEGLDGPIICRPAFSYFQASCARYTPEVVAAITGIDVAQIRSAARAIGAARRVAYHAWSGVGQHTNATQTERAIATLYALTGCYDRPGGNVPIVRQPVNRLNSFDLLQPGQRDKALGLIERPIGPPAQGWVLARDVFHAILHSAPYRVRALVGFGANLAVSHAGTELAHQALENLEFYAHLDLFENPTARYADLLLPVCSPWEREGLRVGFEISAEAEELVQLRRPVLAPIGQSRSDNDIIFDLATRLGMADAFFGGSVEAGWNHLLAPLGLSVEQLRAKPAGVRVPVAQTHRKYAIEKDGRVPGFATQTRRVEIYSERLLRYGYPPVPDYVEPADSPRVQPTGVYPLTLTSAKSGYFCHSQHREIASLRKRARLPVIELHSETARSRGIQPGDWVVVQTRHGSARFNAVSNDDLAPDVAVAEYGWVQACSDVGAPAYPLRGVNNTHFNGLIGTADVDPLSGSSGLRSTACEVALAPDVEVGRRPWVGLRQFVVSAVLSCADEVREVEWTAADGGALPDFEPGQHLTVEVRNLQGGVAVTRSYSLIGPAYLADRRSYRIAVRRIASAQPDGNLVTGVMSHHIVRTLQVGDRAWLRAPNGGFIIPTTSDVPMVLIAAGIGITPFMSVLESLRPVRAAPDITLYYLNRGPSTHVFRARIDMLASAVPGLRVVNFYSQSAIPIQLEPSSVYHHGRFSVAVIPEQLIEARARFYLCGPDSMMQRVASDLAARGVPRFDIFSEVFRSPETLPVLDPGQSFRVQFNRSGRTDVWGSNSGTLLEFAEGAGLSLPSGCRVGQCESCSVTLVRGSVRYLHGKAPEEPGQCLTCCAIPASDLELEA